MNWSLPDYTAPPNAEEIFNQMWERNGLDVALVGHNGSDERNGKFERRGAEHNGRDVARNECDVDCSVGIVDGCSHLTSDVAHSIFQLASLARKKFAQHLQPGRKLIFTPRTLLEKLDSDKGHESDIGDDDKIQLLDSLHIQHGRLTNLEIAFIMAFW